MFTNKEEVLENALRVFAKMNYEKASQMENAGTVCHKKGIAGNEGSPI